ncbi:hypothetical protein [Nocardia sp. alder85J]|uniref:biotin synthase auxiliary protein BsaP n=1 Tax=Nocardia sp. alder85J TaxID=2862949 RepID=UPI001CD5E699|nr:hypothetical protein [Nocardia sp. alder85J]MCX4095131.1 hypothetical protein [Nocardia sp. alder85J]
MDVVNMDAETPHAARYNPFTGAAVTADGSGPVPAAAALGLEPPRYCAQCGRRMIVQVSPDGWWAKCSRHGQIDSKSLDPR